MDNNLIKPSDVGALVTHAIGDELEVRFGIYLPGIGNDYKVIVRIIHKDDRFDPTIQPMDFPMSVVADNNNGLWQTTVNIPLQDGTHFGQPGTYLYRYQLQRNVPEGAEKQIVTLWFTDPFAKMTDVGDLSAFVTPGTIPEFNWEDDAWKVPEIDRLVVYELQVEEFNSTFDGVMERLTYLKSLGVTCLELMPVTSQKLDFDWGYGPLHYFAPNERWGGSQGLKRLINACHLQGIAVILDVVYQHVAYAFAYNQVYKDAQIKSPMIGSDGQFGPQIDYSQQFAQEYVHCVNMHWLEEYRVDGFRYDQVTDLYHDATDTAYAKIAYDTYCASLKIPRFTPSGSGKQEYSRIIQCAEALWKARDVLTDTYTNCAWQEDLLKKAQDMAQNGFVDENFVHLLDTRFSGYPQEKWVQDIDGQQVAMPVFPFQYISCHDKSSLISYVNPSLPDEPFAPRVHCAKLQPFAIALLTCEGIPMLWEGQEFAQNYQLPEKGDLRIRFQREVNWEYFYDECGNPLVRLYRILGTLRQQYPALRSRDSFYYNVQSRPQDGIIAYRRKSADGTQIAMVFLNFTDDPKSIEVPFPEPGMYHEMINKDPHLSVTVNSNDQLIQIDVPSNYGYIFIKEA